MEFVAFKFSSMLHAWLGLQVLVQLPSIQPDSCRVSHRTMNFSPLVDFVVFTFKPHVRWLGFTQVCPQYVNSVLIGTTNGSCCAYFAKIITWMPAASKSIGIMFAVAG
eukprot:2194857-Amphidinium_carterae.1